MTPVEQKLDEKRQIIKGTKRWGGFVARMRNRKADPLNAREFCARHTLNYIEFSRYVNQRTIPKQSTFDAIQTAFRAEGFPV